MLAEDWVELVKNVLSPSALEDAAGAAAVAFERRPVEDEGAPS